MHARPLKKIENKLIENSATMRVTMLACAIFLSCACGYIMSLGAMTFDLVIPSLFLWAAITGILINLESSFAWRRLLLDSALAAAAFVISPLVFSWLRGILAYQAGEVPNMSQTFGYSVLNHLYGYGAIKMTLLLFLLSFALLSVGTFSSTAFVIIAKRIFQFGPTKIEKTRSILLKMGAVIVVMSSAIAVVASMSRASILARFPDGITPALPPGVYSGALVLQKPDRGRIIGNFSKDNSEVVKVIVRYSALKRLAEPDSVEDLIKNICDEDEAQCERNEIFDNVEITVVSRLRYSGENYSVIDKVLKKSY